MGKNDWTREQHILAFHLYNEIPFGTIHMGNPKLQELAKLIGRTVSAVSYKLANFARLDPIHKKRGVKGLPHGAKGEEAVWKEFAHDPEALAFESERLRAQYLGKSVEVTAGIEMDDLPKEGKEREAIVKVRVNQSFFRRRILSAYNFSCCVSGITIPQLLTASHILPWAENKENRLNPKNGLCLNSLHDRAFDRHLMWIEDGFVIRFAKHLLKPSSKTKKLPEWFTSFEGEGLQLPKAIEPDKEFLKDHAAKCKAKHG
jgi:putative restriction endonuclease